MMLQESVRLALIDEEIHAAARGNVEYLLRSSDNCEVKFRYAVNKFI
jgi:hypothetical protein